MIRFRAMLSRVVVELLRDRRTLALMLLAPILVINLMNVIFNTTSDTVAKIGIDTTVPAGIVDNIPRDKINVLQYSQSANIKDTIEKDGLDAYVTIDGTKVNITYENEDPSKTSHIKMIFTNLLMKDSLETISSQIKGFASKLGIPMNTKSFTLEESYVYGNQDSTFFGKIFPVLIGFFVFFFVFLICGIALLRERTSGTLERVLATPIKRSEIVLGYVVGYGIFAIIQTLLMVFYSIYVLGIKVEGNIGWVVVTNILMALVALSMGIFVSTFANSEFQMIQFIPLIVIPQVFFSGIIPLDSMADWVRNIGYIIPLSYTGNALTNIMVKGQGLQYIYKDLAVLIIYIGIFTILNIIGLKRYRKV